MSAVFGLVNLDGRPAAQDDIERMNRALAIHGPDASGTWVEGNIGIGQRLARFTPEDCLERQPMFSTDRQHVLVTDARIDNRPELMEELGISPAEAGQMPDSAFILRAYEKWGDDCARHLIGPYAFALYDRRARSLLLARSPMGERSLFYYETPQRFAFSSAPKGLFALPGVPRELNRQSMADFLVMRTTEPGASFFSGIHRLRSGHSLMVEGGRFRSWQHRALDVSKEIRFPRDEDYVEAFLELFDRVVADSLRSITPVGLTMSGGLDSTSIAASAALTLAREGKRLQTFTEVPRPDFQGTILDGWYADETPFVEAMGRKYENIDIHLMRVDEPFGLDHLSGFFATAEAPPSGVRNGPWMDLLHRELQVRNVRVLLNGVPGNFTISYDGQRLLPQLLLQGAWRKARRQAQALAPNASEWAIVEILARRGLMPLLPKRIWLGAQRLRSVRLPGQTKRYWESKPPIRKEFAAACKSSERAREAHHHFRFGACPESRLKGMLRMGERAADFKRGVEAQFGVQGREPAADMRLVQFCLCVPEDQFLHSGVSRWLIRRAGFGRLPAEVIENRKRGSQLTSWFESSHTARFRILDELARMERSPLAIEMIDLPRIRKLVEQMSTVRGNAAREHSEYLGTVNTGLAAGFFLTWIESGSN